MRRAAGIVLSAAVVLAPAAAGASTNRPSVGLTATPAHVALAGSARGTVRVVNPGLDPLFVDVGRAGFSLDRRGRPKVVLRRVRRAATSWLTVRPRRFFLRAGASRVLTVTSRVPRVAEPGDHDALVLLTTRRLRGRAVAVRMRIGVVVVVRAPGRIVRRLVPRGLHVIRSGRTRVLELLVANAGNVTESLDRRAVHVVLRRGDRQTTLRPEGRDLRPRSSGVVRFAYRGRLRGLVVARVRIGPAGESRVAERTYRIRL